MSAASTLPHGCVPRRCWFNFHAQRHLALQLPSTHHSSFALFLFFVTKSRIFGPNTSGVENTPNFLSFNVIRNPALHWTLDIGHWTLDILCLTLDIGHEALEMRQWTWAIGIGHWTLATYPCWTAPASPLTPCRAASHLPLFLLLCLQ